MLIAATIIKIKPQHQFGAPNYYHVTALSMKRIRILYKNKNHIKTGFLRHFHLNNGNY